MIVVVLAGGVLWSCGSEAPEEIAVGVVVSLTGPNALYGLSVRNGFELALRRGQRIRSHQPPKSGSSSRTIEARLWGRWKRSVS